MKLYQVIVEKRAVVAADSKQEAERVAYGRVVDALDYEVNINAYVTKEISKESQLGEGWIDGVLFSIDNSVVKTCRQVMDDNKAKRESKAADKAAEKYQLPLPHVYE